MNLDQLVLEKAFPEQTLAQSTIVPIDTRPRCSAITPQTKNHSLHKPVEDERARNSREPTKVLPLDDSGSKTRSKSAKNMNSVYPSWLIERSDFMEILETYEKLDTTTIISIFSKSPVDRDAFEVDIAIR